MTRFSFSLRQMLFTVTFIAAMLGVLVWIAQHSPEIFVYATLFSCPIGLLGFGIVIFAAVMLLSVYTSEATDERNLNIAKCSNLLLIGALMISLPVLSAITTIFLLPIIRRG